MNVYVLNTNFELTFVLDSYESLMWIDRYYGASEFEIYAPFSNTYIQNLFQGYYLQIAGSEKTMIIETIQLQTSADTGSHLIIKGRSLESILDRRVVWPSIEFPIGDNKNTLKLQNAISKILDDAIINPTQAKFKQKTWKLRKIPNFIFTSTEDPNVLAATIEAVTLTGENIYDLICGWCEDWEVSYRIRLTEDNKFEFQLYSGVDRSYNQDENLWVVFSPEFNNIVSTDYIDDISPWKNYAIIAGDGEDPNRYTKVYGNLSEDTGSGLDHRELYVDASDISREELPEGQTYDEALIIRGIEQLNENYKDIQFNGEVEAKRQFVYGRDFFCGDIIQMENLYGIEGAARVTEFIINDTSNGLEMYPTFECIQNEGYEEET